MWRPTHINMTISLAIMLFLHTNVLYLFYIFTPFFAILPDLDHHRGYAKNKLWVRLPFKHRGFTHTLLFILLTILIINVWGFYFATDIISNDWFLLQNFFNYMLVEKWSSNLILFILLHWHLIGDFLTPEGVPYLYPIIKKRFAIPITKTSAEPGKYNITGEMYINFFFTIFNLAAIWYIILNFWNYQEAFVNFQESLKNTNQNAIIALFLLQAILSLYLFWADIKKTIANAKDFFVRIFKVLLFLLIGGGISWILLYWINNTEIFTWTAIENIIANYSLYINIIIIWIFGFIWLNLTRKYLVSISYSTSYLINSIYILTFTWLILLK